MLSSCPLHHSAQHASFWNIKKYTHGLALHCYLRPNLPPISIWLPCTLSWCSVPHSHIFQWLLSAMAVFHSSYAVWGIEPMVQYTCGGLCCVNFLTWEKFSPEYSSLYCSGLVLTKRGISTSFRLQKQSSDHYPQGIAKEFDTMMDRGRSTWWGSTCPGSSLLSV